MLCAWLVAGYRARSDSTSCSCLLGGRLSSAARGATLVCAWVAGYRPAEEERNYMEIVSRQNSKKVDKVIAKYLERELSQPPPLQRLARTCIRHCLRTCIAHKAASLQLPLIIFKDLNLDGVVP